MADLRSIWRSVTRSKWFWRLFIPLFIGILLNSLYKDGINKDQTPKPTPAISGTQDSTKIVQPPKSEPTRPSSEKKETEEIIRVDPDKTGKLFGGAVRVSVIGISFEGDPLRHKVTAKVEGFNKSQFFEKADVGTMLSFQDGNLVYEVRLHEVSTFTAEFSGIVREEKK